MAKDPYETLGVQKTDSDAAIRSAYRKLAKRHHPDVNPGKPEAADRFKEISAAYDLLSDKDKRARFDRGEIDGAGNEVPPQRPFYRDFGDAAGREKYRTQAGFDAEDLESIFAQAFGGGMGGGGMGGGGMGGAGMGGGRAGGARAGGRGFSMRGRDAQYQLTIDFLDAVNGTTRRVTLPDGRALDVRIPAGVRDGQVIRLKGQGMAGIGDGATGDALVEITVAPHPLFRREGDDIIVELPVTLQEAVLGASLEVPTIKGPVRLTIPANSGTGSRLRLRGRGIEGKGHQYVELHPVLPPVEEPELAEFLKTWRPRHKFNPRAGTASQGETEGEGK
jgi:DnaJ-class molecular chaperone